MWRFFRPTLSVNTKTVLAVVVILLLAVPAVLGWRFLKLQKQNSQWQAEVKQQLGQLQTSLNYSSSLLWTLKNQIDQLPYQINIKK